jgi:hypothetical protein
MSGARVKEGFGSGSLRMLVIEDFRLTVPNLKSKI